MPCTTLLVGKKASYDGSTIIARTDDDGYDVKKMVVIDSKNQPKQYKTKDTHLKIQLAGSSARYTSVPSVDKNKGIWPTNGINAYNVAMTATETITSNALVLAADPLVEYKKANGKQKEIIGGIGEEEFVTLVLPYIKTAREGVTLLGSLLEKYGTHEANGIAFSDENEIWFLETIGGHHWLATRVKDEEYVIMPNQFGHDSFDLEDAFTNQKENMCSTDLREFIKDNHLDKNLDGKFNPRLVFGSNDDSDHCYNTPRAWYMARYFNPTTYKWDGENADYTPESNNIPYSLIPERKITIEDVKYILSSHYQGTKYDPYGKETSKGKYRSIGVSTTGTTSILQIRDYVPEQIKSIQWLSFGCNAFNTVIPVYTNVSKLPKYISSTTLDVDTTNFYWASRVINTLVDAHYVENLIHTERYVKKVSALSHQIINEFDKQMIDNKDYSLQEKANEKICQMAKQQTDETLNKVLLEASKHMHVTYHRNDN